MKSEAFSCGQWPGDEVQTEEIKVAVSIILCVYIYFGMQVCCLPVAAQKLKSTTVLCS